MRGSSARHAVYTATVVVDSGRSDSAGGRRSRRERADRRKARGTPTLAAGPPPRNALSRVKLLDEDQLDAVHEASLDLLQEIGVEFMGASARAAFAAAGAIVDEDTGLVRIPREVVEHALSSVPEQFTVTPRNPLRRLEVGGDQVAFGLVAGPPTVHDRVRGRRTGNLDDYVTLVKLAQCFDVIHFIGNQPTSPQELPVNTRHLDTLSREPDVHGPDVSLPRDRPRADTRRDRDDGDLPRPDAASRSSTTRACSRSSPSTPHAASTRR